MYRTAAVAVLLSGMSLLGSCTSQTPAPEAERTLVSAADSVAMLAYATTGGDTWDEVRFLRFDFGVERNGERGPTNRHLWNRMSGDYRLEWPKGTDSTVVALFNVNTREGSAFVNGTQAAAPESEEILTSAYRRYINDMYWLMAPAKVFDDGVRRDYVADSSSAREAVLHLSFESVGLTPGDQYWMTVDRQTGDVVEWTYLLQGRSSTSTYNWVAYRDIETPWGAVRLSERKEAVGAPFAILTDHVELPASVAAELFSNPTEMMR